MIRRAVMPPGVPPYKRKINDGLEKPKSLREVPSYLKKVISGFFSRLFYIVSLVWEAAPLLFAAMVLFCILNGILPVVGAYISKDLLNVIAELIGKAASDTLAEDIFIAIQPLLWLFVFYFVHSFLSKMVTRLNTMVTGMAGELVVNHIKLKIVGKAKEVDLASFDRPEFYEKLENANREATMRPIHILSATFNVISALISSLSFIAVLATLSPFAPILIIGAAIPSAIVNFVYRHRNFRYMRMHSKERREMNYYSSLMVNKDNAKEIKILGLGDEFISKYKDAFARYYKGIKSLIVGESTTQLGMAFVSTLVNCILFIYVAYTVVFGEGQIGDYSLYTGALGSISGYISTIFTSTATIYEGTLFINNMMEFMREPVTVVASGEGKKVTRGKHTIELREVSFKYPGSDRYVLKNINLTLDPCDSVVLVGLNGAGKTTLIKLLTRLYDPTEGVILLDGIDIREYDPADLHSIFGIIFQDFGKYAVSAAENIELGDIEREHDREDVEEAAVRSDADGFIKKLPQGYDTPLTRIFEDDGIELSGGQWQKLSVARAFYKNSDIMILDEPTASLDAIAEREVFDRFSELAEGKLTVFVSHRLSSATTASKIVVIDNGEVAEVGNHSELMQKRGKYYELFSTQASRYIEESL
jgi:ABC-type multidrug transport system fused ATPase/permease subunit